MSAYKWDWKRLLTRVVVQIIVSYKCMCVVCLFKLKGGKGDQMDSQSMLKIEQLLSEKSELSSKLHHVSSHLKKFIPLFFFFFQLIFYNFIY